MSRVKTTAVLALVACSSLIGWVGYPDGESVADAQATVSQQVAAQEQQMFTRTGRMDRQDIRYGGHRTQIIAEQDIAPQAQATQARMR